MVCCLRNFVLQEGQLELTHKGQAVYDSALPLDAAMQLYESCTAADNGETSSTASYVPVPPAAAIFSARKRLTIRTSSPHLPCLQPCLKPQPVITNRPRASFFTPQASCWISR